MEKEFWRALLSGWQGILSTTGSVVLLCIALYYWDKPIPRWITLAVAILCFVFASRRAWMLERKARVSAEASAIELAKKPSRTAAEQGRYDKAKACLGKFGRREVIVRSLRHLRDHGPITFGAPGHSYESCQPSVPDGLLQRDLHWALGACAGEGVVKLSFDPLKNERVFTLSPAMESILDQVLYEDESPTSAH